MFKWSNSSSVLYRRAEILYSSDKLELSKHTFYNDIKHLLITPTMVNDITHNNKKLQRFTNDGGKISLSIWLNSSSFHWVVEA